MSKALITGGTGFVGSHVARRLLAEGVSVRCLARPSSNRANLAGLNIEMADGDLMDRASLQRAVSGCEMIFHAAADYRLWARHPEELMRVNVEGSRHVLEAAGEAGARRVVFTSSVAAVGRPRANGQAGLPTLPTGRQAGQAGVGREELDPLPEQLIGPYKKSKLASELLARDYARRGLPVVIVNPSTPIGSLDIKPTPTGKIILDFLNRRLPAYLDTGMNFVDVEDVAAGHWLAAQKGRVGERYILGHRNLSLKEFLDLLARIAGLRPPRFKIPYPVAWIAGALSTGLAALTHGEPQIPLDGVRMAHETMYYDASKAVCELGLPQTPIESAIEKAVRWFRDHGYVR